MGSDQLPRSPKAMEKKINDHLFDHVSSFSFSLLTEPYQRRRSSRLQFNALISMLTRYLVHAFKLLLIKRAVRDGIVPKYLCQYAELNLFILHPQQHKHSDAQIIITEPQ